ncbi:MAG: helix-turn-helix transcriptional regulator [Oscillospiraceae bacterium]|nr:helix-turn-helix transcriptional regulator [Oscillospiraceae bacterium]MBQ6403526.1 helix-turn-helix transcriptional regulator [Oscillospiraceae bacterium]
MDYLEWIPDRIAALRTQKGVSARDMSLSLGQSTSYINKIENRRALPSMTGFLYICEYFGITPREFFDPAEFAPEQGRALLSAFSRLSPSQADHILKLVYDLLSSEETKPGNG